MLGDDRSLILDTGLNKYHTPSTPIPDDAVFRASSTCNAPTTKAYAAAKNLYDTQFASVKEQDLGEKLQLVFDRQREQITRLLNLPDGSEVIIVPSGSDAEYIPIAIAKTLFPDNKEILNIVTQVKEVGAGTAPAAGGLWFSTHAPLFGKLPTHVHEAKQLDGFHDDAKVDTLLIPARTEDGEVVDIKQAMVDAFLDGQGGNAYKILHGVYGGKTGMIDQQCGTKLSKGLTVVDACQGRFQLSELRNWINNDSIVLFTSSKFYQAPPFAGAVIIPPTIAALLKQAPPPIALLEGNYGLNAFVTDKELPKCLESWKPYLKAGDKNNIGLALRWEAGLFEMEMLLSDIEKDIFWSGLQDDPVERWLLSVRKIIEQHASTVEVYEFNSGIISIRLKKPDGSYFSFTELKTVYKQMTQAPNQCYLGQPVDVAKEFGIVRIAIGASTLREFLNHPERVLADDKKLVEKLVEVCRK